MKVPAIHLCRHYTHLNAVGQPAQGGMPAQAAEPCVPVPVPRTWQWQLQRTGTGWAPNRFAATGRGRPAAHPMPLRYRECHTNAAICYRQSPPGTQIIRRDVGAWGRTAPANRPCAPRPPRRAFPCPAHARQGQSQRTGTGWAANRIAATGRGRPAAHPMPLRYWECHTVAAICYRRSPP